MTTTTETYRYTAKGFSDDVDQCEICGKPELKGTVRLVIVDLDGNEDGEVFAGIVCAARRAGRKAAEIRTEAHRADRAREQAVRDTHRAWSNAHSTWFCALRDATLGRDCGFVRILEWESTEEYKAAAAAWMAANPEPVRPW